MEEFFRESMKRTHQFIRNLGEEVMHHRHVRLAAGHLVGAVEDESSGEVDGGQRWLKNTDDK